MKGHQVAKRDHEITKGRRFIDALCRRFPDVPRSIVIKSDVLRNGTRFTPVLLELGKQSFPHSLIWNPDHTWNPDFKGVEKGELITVPWKYDLSDDTPVVIRFDKDIGTSVPLLDNAACVDRQGLFTIFTFSQNFHVALVRERRKPARHRNRLDN